MKKAAFFDIDGTLYRDSLMIEHFKKLLKYEVLDQSLWHTHVKQTYENWHKRRGNYDDYMLELAAIYIESLKGMEKSKMEFVTNQVIDLQGDKVYMYTRSRIQWHLDNGYQVFFISGSPDYLVKRMAKRYGVTDCIGSHYLVDGEDRYTGEVLQMWGSDSKLQAMKRFTEQYGIDLENSYAYGDTNGDMSMFQLVGHPVAINPTRELLTNLKADPRLSRITDVVVERKDVIYLLKPDVCFMASQEVSQQMND
ncbi:HAD-IB family hydrolase [bacterium]|nr:MAG: HAD-IB family hydrolase [bacterium]